MVALARRHGTLAITTCVLVLAGLGLTLTHSTPRLVVSRARATAAALSDPTTARVLRSTRYDRVEVAPVDNQTARVSFLAGSQTVVEVAVDRRGDVEQVVDFTEGKLPYGNWLAYRPGLLVGLAALFVLMAGVVPLRRIRNLDVAAALALGAPLVLLRYQYATACVVLVALGYLVGRLSFTALADAGAPAPATPLIDRVTAGFSVAERVRVLRIVLAALAVTLIMVAVSSPSPIDVLYAVMEGATKLIHGVLPYGHLPGDVIHGDTYPLLSYALYAPLAAITPIHSVWDNIDAALGLTAVIALAAAAALFRSTAGPRRRGTPRSPEAELAGLRMALVWLTFPMLLEIVSTGTSDIAMAALLLGAVLLWRRPGASSAMLAAAAWFKLAPVVLVPIWLAPRRGRRLLEALAGLVAVSLAMIGVLFLLGGAGGPEAMVRAVAFQFSRESPQSLWAVLGVGSLQPLAQAGALALVAAITWRLYREPRLAEQRERIGAAAAAVMIAVQLVANYWTFLYLAWVLPLLALTLFAQPSRQPVAEPASSDRVRIGAAIAAAGGEMTRPASAGRRPARIGRAQPRGATSRSKARSFNGIRLR